MYQVSEGDGRNVEDDFLVHHSDSDLDQQQEEEGEEEEGEGEGEVVDDRD